MKVLVLFSLSFVIALFLYRRLLGAGLEQDRLHRGRLSTCLARLDQLAAEIQLHATAVRLGRLTSSTPSNQLIAHRASFREAGETSVQKYRGSKTDTCLIAGGQRAAGVRSVVAERQRRRKSSVMDQLSNFLKVGLKI